MTTIAILNSIETSLEKRSLKRKLIDRVEIEIPEIDALNWLSQQKAWPKTYWRNRDHSIEMAGVGSAYQLTSSKSDYRKTINSAKKIISQSHRAIKFFGGFSFDAKKNDAQWNEFSNSHFIVPQFEIIRRDNQYLFAYNFVGKQTNSAILKKLDEVLLQIAAPKESSEIYHLNSQKNNPAFPHWQKLLQTTLTQIKEGKVSKVVLARKSTLTFAETLNPFRILRQLKRHHPQCYHFCFQFKKDQSFLGASPERLYKKEGQRIELEALAGTKPRGRDQNDDYSLQNELLNSEKEYREHKFVSDAIQSTILKYCLPNNIIYSPRELLTLKGSQHLLTRFVGLTRKNLNGFNLIEDLQPTPAVAGWPTKKAVEFIRNAESFSRGWYTSPIGIIGDAYEEFAVAIRCGLIEKNKLTLYSGAGIVEGSNAEAEWNEIEYKMKSFLDCLES